MATSSVQVSMPSANKIAAGLGVTTVAVGAVALTLPAVGFAGAGVAAGSIAAGLQGPAVAALPPVSLLAPPALWELLL